MATSKNNNVHSKGSGKKVGRNASVQGFSERLRAAAHILGLKLSDVQIDKLLTYLEQMDRWGVTTSLRTKNGAVAYPIFLKRIMTAEFL